MSDTNNPFSKKDNKLMKNILSLINSRQYFLAINLIRNRIRDIVDPDTRDNLYLKMHLAGFLIDIGNEGLLLIASEEGLKIYKEHEQEFREITPEHWVEYNIGNAKQAIFKIRREQIGYDLLNIDLLNEAKNHFWKSYKLCEKNRIEIPPKILVNLGLSLSGCGRVVEALQYFDLVLDKYPKFPNANVCRSEQLIWLKNLSENVLTINLMYQIMKGFETASISKELPGWMINDLNEKTNYFKKILKELNHDKDSIHKDLKETKEESELLSPYRKFCIANHLCLSEHSLYCNCIGARRDDLTITLTCETLSAVFLPPMEQILNRLKSEFSIARFLMYKSYENEKNADLKTFDNEVVFIELFDGEEIGTTSEMLRTSFRLCFGILDKIAMAICKLFDLDDTKESIYFESFWKPRGSSEKQKNRWKKINEIQNISLIALYTQAHDLNSNTGEWGEYKKWRNLLEHNFMILTSKENEATDKFSINQLNDFVEKVDFNEFKEKTLHLLQLTRSAIFNFAFLVRNEAKKVNNNLINSETHTFGYKNDPNNEG